MPKTRPPVPDWEKVLYAAAHLQRILPEAVLVGGSATALHAGHRISHDADHVLTDLKDRFDTILAELELVAGWKTSRIQRPLQILGSLDGIMTGVRQLIRKKPLETQSIRYRGHTIRLPTPSEMLRIKAVLILKRNATRDYLDFVAMREKLGDRASAGALRPFDRLYPQPNGESALQQLIVQLANPLPYDLEETKLGEYKKLVPKWQNWSVVRQACARCATTLFDELAAQATKRRTPPSLRRSAPPTH